MPDGRVEVRGWAINPDVTSAATVHIYVDGRFARQLTAGAFREDIGRAFPAYGDAHGFSGSLVDLPAGPRQVCAFAIKEPAGLTAQIGCLTVTASGKPSAVPIDAATSGIFGRPFDLDPDSAMLKAIRATSTGANAGEMDLIAKEPIATWFGDWNADVTSAVRDRVTAADSRGAVATLVMYNIPNRDCGDYSANFGVSADKYRAWTRAFVAGLGTSRHIVVIEPDAVPLTYCLTAAQEQERYDLIRYAVDLLADQGSWSYIDAGHTEWVTAEDMAGRLRASGVDRATGFSLNVSNFKPTDRTVAYGTALSKLVGGKHFVVDTSRNGQGEDGNEWCNPMGMGLGSAPTTATGSPLVDAHLWIKPPGESDGGCNGGPGPGDWWREYALMLIRNAVR